MGLVPIVVVDALAAGWWQGCACLFIFANKKKIAHAMMNVIHTISYTILIRLISNQPDREQVVHMVECVLDSRLFITNHHPSSVLCRNL